MTSLRDSTDLTFTASVPKLVALIAVASLAASLIAGQLRGLGRQPLERARALAESGKHEEAERVYLDLVEKDPGDVPLLLELLDTYKTIPAPFDANARMAYVSYERATRISSLDLSPTGWACFSGRAACYLRRV
jgi:hypothetical protein